MIPKKITPDRIKDAIVEIRYISKLPFEIALGLFFKALDDSYKYTNRPPGLDINATTIQASLPKEVSLQIVNASIFFNNKVKIEFKPNSIIFNCLNEYIGWDEYKPEIEKVLLQIIHADIIQSFTRIGIRYISQYADLDLRECIEFSFTFGMPEIRSKSYSFNTEFELRDYRVVLNLVNNIQGNYIGPNNVLKSGYLSIIDIDVIKDPINIPFENITDLLNIIADAHETEKEIFFHGVLKPNFLETLNPTYDGDSDSNSIRI